MSNKTALRKYPGRTTNQDPTQLNHRNESTNLTDSITKDSTTKTTPKRTKSTRIHHRPDEPVGKRNPSTCPFSKGIQSTTHQQKKSSTGRNIIKAENHKAAETLSNLKSLYGKSIRFVQMDPSKKITTALLLRVPHPITPSDVMELVPEIKDASRLTVWNAETMTTVETRSLKIQWDGSRLPHSIDLGILGTYETKPFVHPPVRCYKCQRFNHTFSTCNARHDTCDLCGGPHRTKICVDKCNANQEVKLKCSNCKGEHCTASGRCPTEGKSYREGCPHSKSNKSNQLIGCNQPRRPGI